MRSLQFSHSIFNFNLPVNETETLVFIDTSVTDSHYLNTNVDPTTEVVILNFYKDGIEQISEILVQHQNLKSIQIICHGSDGKLQLGSVFLSFANLADYVVQLRGWRGAIAQDAEIFIKGCNVAATPMGQQFIHQLSKLTGAKIVTEGNLSENIKFSQSLVQPQMSPALT